MVTHLIKRLRVINLNDIFYTNVFFLFRFIFQNILRNTLDIRRVFKRILKGALAFNINNNTQ